MNRSCSFFLLLVMVGLLISSCTSKKDIVLEELGPNEEIMIKVMYITKDAFMNKYGNLIMSKFPNITFNVVDKLDIYFDREIDIETAFRKLIDEEQPDVLLLDPIEFETLAKNGELYELSGIIIQDEYELNGFLPSVLDLLKEKGDGRLYGLAPTFTSEALYYNIDLFKVHGLELPRDGMTWEEVFQLAAAFQSDLDAENRIYGIHRPRFMVHHFTMINEVGKSKGLYYADPEENMVTFDTEGWRRSFELVVNALKSGVVYYNHEMGTGVKMAEIYKNEMFTMGRAAMTIADPSQIRDIDMVTNHLKDYEPFNWGVVTAPTNPINPTINISLNEIFAVNAKSQHLRAAWEIVKFINSEEMAKMQGPLMDGTLLTRTEFIQVFDNRDISAFYSLQPNLDEQFYDSLLPAGFKGRFIAIVDRETEAVLANEKTIQEAIRTIQEDGQKAYDQALAELKAVEENVP